MDMLKMVDRGCLYYFVGNANRKRAYEFLRDRIHQYLTRTLRRVVPGPLQRAIENDLNKLGPDFLHLVIRQDHTLSAPRKYGQGVTESTYYLGSQISARFCRTIPTRL